MRRSVVPKFGVTAWPITIFTGPVAPVYLLAVSTFQALQDLVVDRFIRQEALAVLPRRPKRITSFNQLTYNYSNRHLLANISPQYASLREQEDKRAEANDFVETDELSPYEFKPIDHFEPDIDHFGFGVLSTSEIHMARPVHKVAEKGDPVVVAVQVIDAKTHKVVNDWDEHKKLVFYAGKSEDILPQLRDAVVGMLPGQDKTFTLTPADRGIVPCSKTVTRSFDALQIELLEYAIGLEFNVPDKYGNTRVAKVVNMVPSAGLKKWDVTFEFDQKLEDSDLIYRIYLEEVLEGHVVFAPPRDAFEADTIIGLGPQV